MIIKTPSVYLVPAVRTSERAGAVGAKLVRYDEPATASPLGFGVTRAWAEIPFLPVMIPVV